MWETAKSIIRPTLQNYGQALDAQPVVTVLYLVLTAATLTILGLSLLRGAGRQAYWWSVALALVNIAFSWGHDTSNHMYRFIALLEEYRAGQPGMLLTNPLTGQVLPVFVFYNVAPYLPATFLNLLGVPAWLVFKLLMCGQFLVLAWGLQALLGYSRPADAPPARVNIDFGVGILFLLANYVFLLLPVRAAYAEAWVYALVPWVALSILRPGRGRTLVVLFFVQAASHPIVLTQALICEIAVPFCLSSISTRELLKRSVGPLALALLLAVPFWLPQFLWKDMILGPAGLPARFEDSFVTATLLVHARDIRSIGPWMPLAVLVSIFLARGRLGLRFWIATGLAVAVLLMQWVGLLPLVSKVPVLKMSLFVWRLMLPTAFLMFAAVLIGWRQLPRPPYALLSTLVMLSAVAMVVGAKDKPFDSIGSPRDVQYELAINTTWGVREFLPRLDRLPERCRPDGEVQRATYNDLRRGVVAQKSWVVVRDGSYGFVDYTAPVGACGLDLVLGPVKPGERVQVSERTLKILFGIRMGVLALLALLAPFFFVPRRRTPAPNR